MKNTKTQRPASLAAADGSPVGIDSDSIVASCDCLTKSPNYLIHRTGCKYRLICERDEAREHRDAARKIAKQACELLAENNFEVNYPPMPWEEGSPENAELSDGTPKT